LASSQDGNSSNGETNGGTGNQEREKPIEGGRPDDNFDAYNTENVAADGASGEAVAEQPAETVRTAILMGPTAAGKSTLLLSLTGTPNAFQGFDRPGTILADDGGNGDYQKFSQANWTVGGTPATPEHLPPVTHHFRIVMPPEPAPPGPVPPGWRAKPLQVRLDVMDAAGAHSISKPDPNNQVATQKYREYWQRIGKADVAIVVLPAPCLAGDSEWTAEEIDGHAEEIARLGAVIRESPSLRVIFAINKFERLFYSYGRDAFAAASDRRYALAALRKAVQSKRALMTLLETIPDVADRLIFIPVSFYGFVKEFGHPNIVPWASVQANGMVADPKTSAGRNLQMDLRQEKRFGWLDDSSETEQALRKRWRPFCNKDPFLIAAFWELRFKSRFAFTWDDLFPAPIPVAENAPVRPVQRPLKDWRTVWDLISSLFR
jgi:hypothetical protein